MRQPRFDASRLRLRGGHIRLGCRDGGPGDVNLHDVRLFVELHEQIAFVDAIVVIDKHTRHLPRHARRDERHVPIHIRIVG